jgi:Xaa-Pro aminopeptidase
MKEIKKRLKKMNVLKKSVDGVLLFSSDPNYFYLTNSKCQGIAFTDFSNVSLFIPEMERKLAKKSWANEIILFEKFSHVFEDVKNRIRGRVGINYKNTTVELFKKVKRKVKCKDVSNQLQTIRSVKTDYEVKMIKKACSISKKVLTEIKKELSPSLTEKDVQILIDHNIQRLGGSPAFPTIVASGNNVSIPHHQPLEKKIGKTFLLDFGVNYKGYCSDISRTFGSPLQSKIEEILNKACAMIKPDIKAKSIDMYVRQRLGKLERYFCTALGHGIGITVHEKPLLSKKSMDVLKPGMTFTLEPGVYMGKNSIRIENDYLLTESGLLNLTKF